MAGLLGPAWSGIHCLSFLSSSGCCQEHFPGTHESGWVPQPRKGLQAGLAWSPVSMQKAPKAIFIAEWGGWEVGRRGGEVTVEWEGPGSLPGAVAECPLFTCCLYWLSQPTGPWVPTQPQPPASQSQF